MTVDVLAIGAHPDDVEMAMGGTVAKMISRGRSVTILDLTRGEMGTKGSPETRAEEAKRSAELLGVKDRITLDMGDGVLMNSIENRDSVIEVIRDLRPKIVFANYWDDLHPDHAAAGQIVKSTMYPSGFGKYPVKGDPFRPHEFLFYMAHTVVQPSLIVDVSDVWDRKMEAVKCYASQITPDKDGPPQTFISSGKFISALEARSRAWGRQIQREFGEAFFATRAVPTEDPVALYEPFTKLYATRKST